MDETLEFDIIPDHKEQGRVAAHFTLDCDYILGICYLLEEAQKGDKTIDSSLNLIDTAIGLTENIENSKVKDFLYGSIDNFVEEFLCDVLDKKLVRERKLNKFLKKYSNITRNIDYDHFHSPLHALAKSFSLAKEENAKTLDALEKLVAEEGYNEIYEKPSLEDINDDNLKEKIYSILDGSKKKKSKRGNFERYCDFDIKGIASTAKGLTKTKENKRFGEQNEAPSYRAETIPVYDDGELLFYIPLDEAKALFKEIEYKIKKATKEAVKQKAIENIIYEKKKSKKLKTPKVDEIFGIPLNGNDPDKAYLKLLKLKASNKEREAYLHQNQLKIYSRKVYSKKESMHWRVKTGSAGNANKKYRRRF